MDKTLTIVMKRLLFILSFFMAANIYASSVKFTVNAPSIVRNGEHFNVQFSINENGSEFKAPNFKDFNFLGGPMQAQSSQMRWVNGKFTQSASYTYTYDLQAKKEGIFTIGSASIKVGGKVYKTKAHRIKVVKGRKPQNRRNQQSQNLNLADDDIFVRIDLDKTTVYQGQPVLAQLKFYSNRSVQNVGEAKFPQFQGFWTQELPMPQRISLVREEYKGRLYNAGVVKKVLLYPQKSGKIKIDPFSYELYINIKVRRASFWDDGYKTIPVKEISAPRTVNVKPLPANAPDGFVGAVGNYKMRVSLNKTDVKAHDALTLKVKLSGKGNIKLLEAPKINFPPDFEVYDPKVANNFNNTAKGQEGTKTFEYLIIPKNPGQYTIPSIRFSYFDIRNRRYRTQKSEEFKINVERGAADNSKSMDATGVEQESIKHLSKDIKFIKTDFELKKPSKVFYGTTNYYSIYILALVAFGMLYLLMHKQEKDRSNVALVKNRKANKLSQKKLKQASDYLKNSETEKFYNEILRALWGYLSDKLTIPVSDLSRDNVSDRLNSRGVDSKIVDNFIKIIDVCEFARYAPSASSESPKEVLKSSSDIIIALENGIRKSGKKR